MAGFHKSNNFLIQAFLEMANGQKLSKPSAINLEELVKFAKFHDIIPLLFQCLKNYPPLKENNNYSLIEKTYFFNIAKNMKFWQEFLNITDGCTEKSVQIIPLKGIDILARFYPYFELRNMVDIDLLVKKDDYDKTEKILCALGYKKKLSGLKETYWKEKQCHIAFYKKPFIVEIHWDLDFKRHNRNILQRLWQKTLEKKIENKTIKILSAEDALFSLALHLRRFGNILALKQVFDAARIIKEYKNFDWDYILEESQRSKIQATIYFLLTQIELFTDTLLPTHILNDLRVNTWQKKIIRKFVTQNTFKLSLDLKNIYLKAHLLFYDNLTESIGYLINIPYEQFCKFYSLKPYTKKSNIFYKIRFLYISAKLFLKKFKL